MTEEGELVCWRETHDDWRDAEEHGTAVVFARTEEEALQAVADWHGWGKDELPHGVVREPQFDHLRDKGHVPNETLLAAGWWLSCADCGNRVTEDGTYDDDTDEWTAPVIDHYDVFCSESCRDDLRHSQAENKRKKAAALAAFERMTHGAPEVVENYSTTDGGRVRFRIPGGIAAGTFKWSDAEPNGSFWVNPHDIKPFRHPLPSGSGSGWRNGTNWGEKDEKTSA